MGKYVPLTTSAPNAIRKYADLDVEASMKKVLDRLPSGKKGAVVMYADEGGIRGAIYGRKKGRFFGLLPAGEWSYVGTLGTTYQGQLEGSAAVAYSWP